jgi:hypothetical protein
MIQGCCLKTIRFVYLNGMVEPNGRLHPELRPIEICYGTCQHDPGHGFTQMDRRSQGYVRFT